MKGAIKGAKCWSGQAVTGGERNISRLLYCLSFFHAAINDRCQFGSIGGLSASPTFTMTDLALGVHFLELISREFDPIPFEGLIDLIGDCGYANHFMTAHDRELLAVVLDDCINEKAVSTNRYRFSSASDFFVPNKTLYKDYIEFIKSLPAKSDNEVLDLEPSCQLIKAHDKGVSFLMNLFYAIRDKTPHLKVDVVKTLNELLATVTEAIKAHDSIPFLDDGPLQWLWINEMTRHDLILATAFEDLDKVNRCVIGEKVLDDWSLNIVNTVADAYVPNNWTKKMGGTSSLAVTICNFMRLVRQRSTLYQVSTIPRFFVLANF